MKQYHELLRYILANGVEKTDRTGVGTKSVFGYQMRFDLQEGFPMVTTKRVPFSLVSSELFWFLRGDNNLKYLLERNNHIWDEWGFKRFVESPEYHGPDMTDFGKRCLVDSVFNEQYQEERQRYCDRIVNDPQFAERYGTLGNIYGVQWRRWQTTRGETIDQIKHVIQQIKENPDSRRLIVSAWNPEEIETMALPPCHTLFQFYVSEGALHCQLYQRSADVFLGVPFNIASYALLTHLIANETNLKAGTFVHTLGDAHVYLNHMDQVAEQLSRPCLPLPQLVIKTPHRSIFELDVPDVQLEGYHPHPKITAPIAV